MVDSPSRACARAVIWPVVWGLLIFGLVCWVLRAHSAPPETSWAALILGFFIWVGGAALCALTLKGLSLAHDFWLALAAMWRPLALVLVGAFLLFFNDQGRELGVSLMIDGAGWFHLIFLFAMLFLALLYWSLNNWHSARLGVGAALDNGVLGVIPSHPLPEKPNAHVIGEDEQWLFWLPRTLGVCAHFFAAINLALAAWSQPDFVQEPLLVHLLAWTAPLAIVAFTCLVYFFDRYALSERTAGEKSAAARVGSLAGAASLLLVIAVLAFVNFHSHSPVWARFLWGTFTLSLSTFVFLILVSFLRRGKLLGADAPVEDRRKDDRIEAESLARWTRWLFVPTVVVFLLVWFWAPLVGRAVGSMVVAYFALGAVLATVNAFELAVARLVERGWFGEGVNPRVVGRYAVAALIALGILNAWLHPFHGVRPCDGGDCVAPKSAAAYVHEPNDRPSVESAAEVWYEQAKAAFLKAHDGRMDENERVPMVVVATAGGGIRAAYWTAVVLEKLKKDLGPAGLRPYLFAISGVSGGSVGATAFDAALAKSDESGCGETCAPATDFLTEDFLAPTLASGIFKDLPASFLPDLWQDDRGAALEEGFEHASDGLLARPFLSLFPYGGQPSQTPWRPILLLNGTHEESGKRIVASHVLVERNVFIDALDGLHVLERDVRASTAAHNSARFSYISPAGNLGRRKVRAVDSKGWPTDWESSEDGLERLAGRVERLGDRRRLFRELRRRVSPRTGPSCESGSGREKGASETRGPDDQQRPGSRQGPSARPDRRAKWAGVRGEFHRARTWDSIAVAELSFRRSGTSRERLVERVGRAASGRGDRARGARKQGRRRARPRNLRTIRAPRPDGLANDRVAFVDRAVLVADAGRRHGESGQDRGGHGQGCHGETQ